MKLPLDFPGSLTISATMGLSPLCSNPIQAIGATRMICWPIPGTDGSQLRQRTKRAGSQVRSRRLLKYYRSISSWTSGQPTCNLTLRMQVHTGKFTDRSGRKRAELHFLCNIADLRRSLPHILMLILPLYPPSTPSRYAIDMVKVSTRQSQSFPWSS